MADDLYAEIARALGFTLKPRAYHLAIGEKVGGPIDVIWRAVDEEGEERAPEVGEAFAVEIYGDDGDTLLDRLEATGEVEARALVALMVDKARALYALRVAEEALTARARERAIVDDALGQLERNRKII